MPKGRFETVTVFNLHSYFDLAPVYLVAAKKG